MYRDSLHSGAPPHNSCLSSSPPARHHQVTNCCLFVFSDPPPEWSTLQVLSLLRVFARHTPCVGLLFLFSSQAVVDWHGTVPSVWCVCWEAGSPLFQLAFFVDMLMWWGSEPPRCPFQWEKMNWCYTHTHRKTPHEPHSSPAEGYL